MKVKFDDNIWYPGTIEKKLDGLGKFSVLYDDGEREDVVIERVPSDEFRAVRQSRSNIRVWRVLLSMTKKTSMAVAQHEAARERRGRCEA